VAVADSIVVQELDYLARRYGDKHQRGREPRAYHNALHAAGSVEAVARIVRSAVRSGRLMTWHVYLGRVATAFHDDEQGLSTTEENVMASADRAALVMREHSDVFSNDDIALVRAGIASTRVRIEDGMVVQIVDSQDPFCAAVADADLAHLGISTAIQTSLDLNEELQLLDGRLELNRDITIEFLQFSAKFILTHRFHLPESREMFRPGQQENHRRLVELTDKYVRRELTYKQLRQFAAMSAKGSALA